MINDNNKKKATSNGSYQFELKGSMYFLSSSFTEMYDVQCRHLIPALNEWAARAKFTTARPIATQFPGHGCMCDVTTERSFVSQAMCVIDVLR